MGVKFGEERLTDASQILSDLGLGDMGCHMQKETVSISSAVLAQCTNVTDRQTDHGTVTSIPICIHFSATVAKNLTNIKK